MFNFHHSWSGPAFALLFISLAVGCSSRVKQSEGHDNTPLVALSDAYQQATQKLNRPPASADELAPHLPAGKSLESVLKSPADGQPYVILWGTDPRSGMDLKPLVIGYEKQGKGGNRFVFTAMGVMLMSAKDFESANFPAGHRPS